MIIDVLVFGIAREIAGTGTIAVELNDGESVGRLKEVLSQQYARLGALSSFAIAVNGLYTSENTLIKKGDEVAVIPPVSGG